MINMFILLYFSLYSPQSGQDVWTIKGDPVLKQTLYENNINKRLENWAKDNLHTGDIIFSAGNEYIFMFNFSQYIREITQSSYSHTGIVICILNKTWVFDCDRFGYRKIPFSCFMKECNNKEILVMRVRTQYQAAIAPAIAYCWKQYLEGTPFDFDFRLGNNALYCAEAVVQAFKQGRLLLQEPVKAGDLPGVDKHIVKTLLVMVGSYIYCERPFSLQQKLFTAGGISNNNRYLEKVYEGKP